LASGAQHRLQSAPLTLEVLPPAGSRSWIGWVSGAIAAVLGAVGWAWRHRRARPAQAPAPDPQVQALAAVRDDIESGRSGAAADRLQRLIVGLLVEKHGLAGAAEDPKAALDRSGLAPELCQRLAAALELLQAIRYGGARPERAELEQARAAAGELLQQPAGASAPR
jgi:hypothetical protein